MPTARKHTTIPGQPGFYHCISRCVRHAWLCGTDKESGNNYDHRRDWMVERMQLLTTCFAIDIYAYAFMSNHYHIVLYVDPERADSWTDDEVVRKWRTLWNWRNPDRGPVIPKYVSQETIQQWRERLADVSWVMRLLNEPMARIANAEDDAKGHFWESRFKCNALLDEQGLVTCMVYADLNPIKAGIAKTPVESDYTSIQKRICQLADKDNEKQCDSDDIDTEKNEVRSTEKSSRLHPVASATFDRAPAVGISLESYIKLAETTAEAILQTGAMVSSDTLMSLGIKVAGWTYAMSNFSDLFRAAAGSDAAFTVFMQRTGRKRRQDAAVRRFLFS